MSRNFVRRVFLGAIMAPALMLVSCRFVQVAKVDRDLVERREEEANRLRTVFRTPEARAVFVRLDKAHGKPGRLRGRE